MIPRLKPHFGIEEFLTAFNKNKTAIIDFENAFAEKFGAKHAVVFSYGRTGIYCLLKTLNFSDMEIIIPAYTCEVVASAVVLSGNKPKFVDITKTDFNMDLELLDKAITKNTGAIIATHLFGYPLDMNKVKEIVKKHEKIHNKKIYVINDCAHSFGAISNNNLVCNSGDVAVFGLNISKIISTVFGGILTTNNEELYYKLIQTRNDICKKATIVKDVKRYLYLLSTYITFSKTVYSFVNVIEENTNIIDRFTKYYDESTVQLPKDWDLTMCSFEAKVGLQQLKKYDDIIKNRIKNAKYYNEILEPYNNKQIKLPILVDGATYSHYVFTSNNRNEIVNFLKKKGIQLGILIEYSIPYLKTYKKYADSEYPVSYECSQTSINLPIYSGVDTKTIGESLVKCFKEGT